VNKAKKGGRHVPARHQKLLVAGKRPQDLDVVLGGDRHQSLHVGWLRWRYAQLLGRFAHFHGESLEARRVVAAAKAQRHELPAAEAKAALVAEIASEVLRTKERINALDTRLGELVEARPEGKVVMSLPGMGTIMTAEFLAEADDLWRFGSPDRFAAAAGIAPVFRESGSVSYRRRAKRGNRA
jgi:transposase